MLTNESLYFATTGEFSLLGEALKGNTSLLVLDISDNTPLNEAVEHHAEVTEGLLAGAQSKLRKLYITSGEVDVLNHYLEVIDQRPKLMVFNRGKLLEDVDVLEEQ